MLSWTAGYARGLYEVPPLPILHHGSGADSSFSLIHPLSQLPHDIYLHEILMALAVYPWLYLPGGPYYTAHSYLQPSPTFSVASAGKLPFWVRPRHLWPHPDLVSPHPLPNPMTPPDCTGYRSCPSHWTLKLLSSLSILSQHGGIDLAWGWWL